MPYRWFQGIMKVGDSLQFYRADLPIIHGAVSKLFINSLGSNQRILREKTGCLEERHFREPFFLCYPLENRRTYGCYCMDRYQLLVWCCSGGLVFVVECWLCYHLVFVEVLRLICTNHTVTLHKQWRNHCNEEYDQQPSSHGQPWPFGSGNRGGPTNTPSIKACWAIWGTEK